MESKYVKIILTVIAVELGLICIDIGSTDKNYYLRELSRLPTIENYQNQIIRELEENRYELEKQNRDAMFCTGFNGKDWTPDKYYDARRDLNKDGKIEKWEYVKAD